MPKFLLVSPNEDIWIEHTVREGPNAGKVYYNEPKTGQVVWTKPKDAEIRKDEDVLKPPPAPPAPKAPMPWSAVWDPGQSQYYYSNEETCEATWEVPKEAMI